MRSLYSREFPQRRNIMFWVVSYLILAYITHNYFDFDYNITIILVYTIVMGIIYAFTTYTAINIAGKIFYLNEKTFFKEFGKKYGMHSENSAPRYGVDNFSNATHIDVVICTLKGSYRLIYVLFKNESELIGWQDFHHVDDEEIDFEKLAKRVCRYNEIDLEIKNVYYESTDKQSIIYKLSIPLPILLCENFRVRCIISAIIYVVSTIALFIGLGISIPSTFGYVAYVFGFMVFSVLNYYHFISSVLDYEYFRKLDL